MCKFELWKVLIRHEAPRYAPNRSIRVIREERWDIKVAFQALSSTFATDCFWKYSCTKSQSVITFYGNSMWRGGGEKSALMGRNCDICARFHLTRLHVSNINKTIPRMIVSHLVYLWFYINNGGDTQFRLSQEKHQENEHIVTSIYNKTYIKIIFSAKQLAYAISPSQ